ncbi:MAG: hypothetical protein V4473_00450 [Patescibacteria group bacterium]
MDDNARKFIVEKIDQKFLIQNNSISFNLIIDWIETAEDKEKKVVFKTFETGETQIFFVSKIITNGNRISDKKKISEDEYKNLLDTSILHLEKKRHEFNFIQNSISFSLKYDEFASEKIRILEVDSENSEERNLFNPNTFPYRLTDVTGDKSYEGFRIVKML